MHEILIVQKDHLKCKTKEKRNPGSKRRPGIGWVNRSPWSWQTTLGAVMKSTKIRDTFYYSAVGYLWN